MMKMDNRDSAECQNWEKKDLISVVSSNNQKEKNVRGLQ